MGTILLTYTGEQLLSHRTEESESGEAERDESKAMGPASGCMVVPLTLLDG